MLINKLLWLVQFEPHSNESWSHSSWTWLTHSLVTGIFAFSACSCTVSLPQAMAKQGCWWVMWSPVSYLIPHPHPVQLSLPGSMRVVSGFDRVYHAAQLHFHWGSVEEPGSEHTIDNVHFPAEVSLCHPSYQLRTETEIKLQNWNDWLKERGEKITAKHKEGITHEHKIGERRWTVMKDCWSNSPGVNINLCKATLS